VLDAVEAFVPWQSSAQRAARYKSQASVLAYQSARLAALTFAERDAACAQWLQGQARVR